MSLTLSTEFTFTNQIASVHTSAYFRKRLVIARFGQIKSTENIPGKDTTEPYFKKTKPAKAGVENTAVEIDNLVDAEFQMTVDEVVKGLGLTDSAKVRFGAPLPVWEQEAHRQIGRVFAEKLEDDVWTELKKPASFTELSSPSKDFSISKVFGVDKGTEDPEFKLQELNIRALTKLRTRGLGDDGDEAFAVIMHSSHYNSIELDQGAGFLKADARFPLFKLKGFKGYTNLFLGLAFFVNDGVPAGADITVTDSGSATQKYKTFYVYLLKRNSFCITRKKRPTIEYDRDITKRADIMVASQWYGVTGLHKKVSPDDVKIVRQRFTVPLETS